MRGRVVTKGHYRKVGGSAVAYEPTDVEVEERSIGVEAIVLVAAHTVIAGISLTSFLVAVAYSLVLGRWLLAAGVLCGTVVVLVVYYRGLQTIFLEVNRA